MKRMTFLLAFLLLSAAAVPALPGDLDATFGASGGYFVTDLAAAQRDERPRDTAIQGDGKIVVVGWRGESLTNFYDVVVARFNPDGTPDTTFNRDGYFVYPMASQLDSGNAVAIQSDGKIVVAGGTGGTSVTSLVFRLNSDGSLDSAFDTDGIAMITGPGEAFSVAIQADGKIVFGASYNNIFTGYTATVARLNANGSPDNSFNGYGQMTISPNLYFPYGLVLQDDGKIILAGTSSNTSSTQDVSVIRLNSNGTYDTGFDGDGLVRTEIAGEGSEARSVIVQNDGKIVVGGGSDFGAQDSPILIRYNSDGSLDRTFDGDGIRKLDIANVAQDGYFHDVVQQPDGKLIGIYSNSSTVFPFPLRDDFYIFRLNSNGANDVSFDANGVVRSQWCENGSELSLQNDGKIVATGSLDRIDDTEYIHGICVQRFNSNGSVDFSFRSLPTNGKAVLSEEGLIEAFGVAGLPNGQILVAGSREKNGITDAILLRLNADGSLDTTFMDEGIYVRSSDSTTQPFYFFSLKILGDGSFFVGGVSTVVKFTAAGIPDTSFSGDGVATPGLKVFDILIQSDAKVVVCGTGSLGGGLLTGRIARISATGTIEASVDNSLGTSATNSEILGCGLQSDGKIAVAGYGFDGTSDSVRVSRHLSTLGIDTGFGTAGIVTTDLSSSINERGTDLVVQPDGKIVVTSSGLNGGGDLDFAVIRYASNGTLDPNFNESFGSGGISLIDFVLGSPNDDAAAILLQPDGQFLVGGSTVSGTDGRFGVAKLNPGGSPALGFGTLGRVRAAFPGNDASINALAFYLDDRVITAGRTWNGTSYDLALARFENELIPTAASAFVSGRVLTADGRGIRDAMVTITNQNGVSRTLRTGAFGVFRFDDLAVGETYVVSVASKRFTFTTAASVVELKDSILDLNFIADQQK
jgi:uncharacterized delta-60 repeat protein